MEYDDFTIEIADLPMKHGDFPWVGLFKVPFQWPKWMHNHNWHASWSGGLRPC